MSRILEISNVSKTYDVGSANPVQALDGVDLHVEEGEFVSVIGPSGCGKSTLFNIIGGLIADYEGSRSEQELRLVTHARDQLKKSN